ncbi:MAG: Bug family tripartite tricarboxylate transporter substrate binding protein [Burkholderiales bacterium]
MFSRLTLSILVAAGFVGTSPVLAQPKQGYPVKPIHVVSGFPPGGVNDAVARTISTKLAENFSTAVVVDNRPGAAGTLAAAMVARAEPNGYTLLVYSSGFAINAAIQESLPYDPRKDFAGVAQIGPITQALIVSPLLGVKSVTELVALAKAQPGKIILGSSGAGTGSHLIGENVRLVAGIKVVHVGFKGNADMLIQIAGGRVHYGISALGPAMPLVKDGKLMVLAVTSPQRSAVLPDVPTLAESLPGFKYQGGFGLLAPARTPRNIVNLLNKEVGQILGQADARERLVSAGIVPTTSSPEQFDRIVREEIEYFTKLVRDIGLRKP